MPIHAGKICKMHTLLKYAKKCAKMRIMRRWCICVNAHLTDQLSTSQWSQAIHSTGTQSHIQGWMDMDNAVMLTARSPSGDHYSTSLWRSRRQLPTSWSQHTGPVLSLQTKVYNCSLTTTTTTTTTTINRFVYQDKVAELSVWLLHPFNGLFSRTTWVSRYQKL